MNNIEINTTEKIPFFKQEKNIKAIVIMIGILLLETLILYIAYDFGKTAKVESEAVNQLYETRAAQDGEIKSKKTEIKSLNAEIESLSADLELAKDYKDNKETYEQEISDKTSQVISLDAQISSKQTELSSLTDEIIKAKAAPITLLAGQYTVGTDLPEGRYRVSGSSNFIVYSSSGSLKVNTILGDSRVGEGDYVCTLLAGDSMKCNSRTTFTPIE